MQEEVKVAQIGLSHLMMNVKDTQMILHIVQADIIIL